MYLQDDWEHIDSPFFMAYIRRLSSRVSSFSDFLFVNLYSRHEYSFNYCSLDILIRWRSSWMLDHMSLLFSLGINISVNNILLTKEVIYIICKHITRGLENKWFNTLNTNSLPRGSILLNMTRKCHTWKFKYRVLILTKFNNEIY